MSRVAKTTVSALAIGACSVAIAAPAVAKTEHIKGGHATVSESSQVTQFLHALGITVTPIGPASFGSGSMGLPMTGGRINVPTMGGVMLTKGGFKYTKGSRTLTVTGYRLTHVGHVAKLTAVVHGKRIVIATMRSPHVKMTATHGKMSGALRLSSVWAHLINHLLGMHVVHGGESLGSLTATVKMG
jgi:hypothetical protein